MRVFEESENAGDLTNKVFDEGTATNIIQIPTNANALTIGAIAVGGEVNDGRWPMVDR